MVEESSDTPVAGRTDADAERDREPAPEAGPGPPELESEPEAGPDPGLEPEPEPEPARRRRLRAAVALTLVAAIVVFGALGGSRLISSRDETAADADPSPTSPPRLAVVGPDGALSTMAADGGSVVRFESPGVTLQFPAWSPDGTRIAAPGTTLGGTSGVYVFDANDATSPPKTLFASAASPPFYLSWAPDGRHVTFLAQEPTTISLRVAPADGSAEATILRRGAPMYWDWVDADRVIVHAGNDSAEGFLGELGLGSESDARTEIAPGFFRPPDVGSDGRYRAYVIPSGNDTAAVVVERADGSGRHEIPAVGSVAIGFDPAGRTVAWTASGAPTGDQAALPIGPLHAIDAETGADRTLLDAQVVGFYWSPDSRTVAALRIRAPGEPGVDIAAVETTTTDTEPAVNAPGIVLQLVFVDAASGAIRSERPVALSELYVFQLLPFFDQYALSHRTWSPDSSSIALPLADDAGKTEIFLIPADGGDPRSIADGVMAFWSP